MQATRGRIPGVAIPGAVYPAPGVEAGGMSTLRLRPSRLSGTVTVSGAKNSALRLMVASLLTAEPILLDNVPVRSLDSAVQIEMLRAVGKLASVSDARLHIHEPGSLRSELDWQGRSIRNTLLMLGALVTRTGAAAVPLPGGCDLGGRGYDFHEMVLRQMGAVVRVLDGRLVAEARGGRLRGCDITLPLRSTGATENALLCATLAEGTTRIWNPHVRPEILDLVKLLEAMGSEIQVRGQESILVHGRTRLGSAAHRVIPDNMEAITWVVGAAVTGGRITIRDFPADDLAVALIFLRASGIHAVLLPSARGHGHDLVVQAEQCYPVEISTGPHPGINSDMQPLFAALATQARGVSRIVDLRFPNRYGYSEEFAKLGVERSVTGGMLSIRGGVPLRGARVRAGDLRGGVALALLGLVASGTTIIENAWQIQRGYEDVVGKLEALGADIAAG
jgi:UDP-N-acetylglucosamine 1-carboxyvinyltransferase